MRQVIIVEKVAIVFDIILQQRTSLIILDLQNLLERSAIFQKFHRIDTFSLESVGIGETERSSGILQLSESSVRFRKTGEPRMMGEVVNLLCMEGKDR